MGWIAFTAAVAGAVSLALPWPGMFAAMALAIMAIGTGLVGWQRRHDPGPARLAAAGAITTGAIALALAMLKYSLTLLALDRLERMLL